MTPNEAISHAQRRLRAACALYRDGLVPECHVEMLGALEAALAAWEPAEAHDATDEHPALAVLAERGYELARLRPLLAARDAGAKDLRPGFEDTWAEAERLVNYTAKALRSPAERKRRRQVALGAAAALVVLALVLSARVWGRVRARASAVYNAEFPASYAVDGIESTEWLLPDRTLGWLDVYLPRPRSVRTVEVVNGHNRYYLDRATRKLRVTAYAGNEARGSVEAEFPPTQDKRSARKLKLSAEGVTRLHLEILSYYGAGGTIAEVKVR